MPVTRHFLLPLVVLAGMLAPAGAAADDRFAAPGGDGPPSTCAVDDPCSLEDAIEDGSVQDGDRVFIAAGSYGQTSELEIDDAITVSGGTGFFLPTIGSTAPGNALSVNDPGALVRDVAIDQTAGTSALVISAGTVERVRARTAGLRACGLGGSGADVALLRNSTCWSTQAGGQGVGVSAAGAGAFGTLRNVTAYAAEPLGVGLQADASGGGTAVLDARNVIAAGDGFDVRAEVDGGSTATVTLATSNYATVDAGADPDATVTAPGTGSNQIAEPLLVDPAAGVFNQSPASPTIDAGSGDPLIGTSDFEGEPRARGPRPDIGADEVADSAAPQTTITSAPPGLTRASRQEFTFISDEPGSTFECALELGFQPCTSPFESDALGQGTYAFRVRATDPFGNTDPTPAERRFSVDRNVSGVNASAKRVQRQRGRSVTLTMSVRAGEDVRVRGSGRVRLSKRRSFSFRSREASISAGGGRKLILKPRKRSASRRIIKALRGDGVANGTLTAAFADEIGNRARTGRIEVRLKGG